jgi:hypothetical protein
MIGVISKMTFSVRYECGGRLGNCVFPYLLCILYQTEYSHTYTITPQSDEICIDDTLFLTYFWNPSSEQFQLPQISANIVFRRHFKQAIVEFLKKHPDQDIHTGCNEHYPSSILLNGKLPDVELDDDTLVVHLRMEDKVTDIIEENSPLFVIHPDDYAKVLASIPHKKILWVMNKPTQEIEHRYLSYLQMKYGGEYATHSLEEDMALMRQATKLVCSRSSLSWISSAFDKDQYVAMPEKYENWQHETFRKVHPTTSYFSYRKASKKDLEKICL